MFVRSVGSEECAMQMVWEILQNRLWEKGFQQPSEIVWLSMKRSFAPFQFTDKNVCKRYLWLNCFFCMYVHLRVVWFFWGYLWFRYHAVAFRQRGLWQAFYPNDLDTSDLKKKIVDLRPLRSVVFLNSPIITSIITTDLMLLTTSRLFYNFFHQFVSAGYQQQPYPIQVHPR